jgi:adenylylsulfate kinase
MIIQLCGLSGAGKSTLALRTQNLLTNRKIPVEIIDGDDYRSRLSQDLGFSRADRQENIRRLGFIASRFAAHGIVSIISAINPYEAIRKELAAAYPEVKTVFLDCCLEELARRDTKGLYRRALLPDGHPDKVSNLTGVNDTFEPPRNPDLHLHTGRLSVDECATRISGFILDHLNIQFVNTVWPQQPSFKLRAYDK